jgi:phytoene synthase
MGVGHYENFPVASLLLPARLRSPVAAIYHFARAADDLADEGDVPAAERLRRLHEFGEQLRRIERREPVEDPLFLALAAAIERHRLPLPPFHDLLDAFAQDCVQSRYARFGDLLDYSRRSANPVGRLLLHLFGAASSQTFACADRICSALQLINFWQDVALDFAKDRIYLPREDMQRFEVSEAHIAAAVATPQFRALLRFQIARTRSMLHEGAELGRILRGRIGLEIRMIVAGGDTILQKLLDADCDVFRQRPMLRAHDWLAMLMRSLAGDGRIAA